MLIDITSILAAIALGKDVRNYAQVVLPASLADDVSNISCPKTMKPITLSGVSIVDASVAAEDRPKTTLFQVPTGASKQEANHFTADPMDQSLESDPSSAVTHLSLSTDSLPALEYTLNDGKLKTSEKEKVFMQTSMSTTGTTYSSVVKKTTDKRVSKPTIGNGINAGFYAEEECTVRSNKSNVLSGAFELFNATCKSSSLIFILTYSVFSLD